MDEENRILDLDREWNEAYARLDCAALDRIIADDNKLRRLCQRRTVASRTTNGSVSGAC